ncbi:hypothetical protein MJO28_004778 [Puccinia striiformis f. sp. tritici]|uniref:HMG box domain-containing protein n=2 Tax=Puccinia striiformis f. sp. tritici TaxID=168172 RepID=A0A0L0VMP7_9BASI|nr:hypothetical protein Pst134EA_009016 [Puccinia striiformis f. sp. tritici]KAH9468473.1 hypothetical protein Pst134EA_009016 [Puccinia striiformis f. sp. tritici]KAI7954378.1 hypothetical protein MJO28_004778 [Puccinia striiformis f. sp. tritici]KAI9627344.1 hypothetical protein H4Q26_017442 [Puccinia striiformis f. sp. tritici PST-130]KNF00549.1 hypothetical protein PSTG_06241 [Puccinia striiformis f. sp. tritici PST-78]
MDFHEETADPFDEILRSIKASSQDSSPKEEPSSHDFHNEIIQTTDEHKASPLEFYSSVSETFPPSPFGEDPTGVFSPNFESPFHTMITPTWAIEPPTAQGDTFPFLDMSNAGPGISRLQTSFESPLKTSLNFHDSRGLFHSSPSEMFPSPSPNSSPEAFTTFPFSPHNFYDDHVPAYMYPKEFGVPIARANIRAHSEGMPGGRRGSRHHRDLSGTSSTFSTISAPPYDACAAIDPSALQPPLGKLQAEFGLANNETSYIISPFINHVMEHGPDGTMTGRYSRPLTSTGRPSHARKTPPGHVKRPRNAFILFRSHACSSNLIPPTVEKDHRQISRIVSHMWKSLPADEKLKWERKAEEEKDLHRKLHPDYRYKPIYRKENSGKKNQGRSPSSSAAKKKAVTRKNAKGSNVASYGDLSTESEDFTGLHKKSPADLLRERDEEIRCEIVAKVLMETKLSGITLDEGEMEERVLQQVRLVKLNDAHQFPIEPQSDIGEGDQLQPTLSYDSERSFPSLDDYSIIFPNSIPGDNSERALPTFDDYSMLLPQPIPGDNPERPYPGFDDYSTYSHS